MKITEYIGAVTAASSATPGPASGITYTVTWETPAGIVSQSGLAPSQRWPDDIDTVPYSVTDPTKRVAVRVIDIEGFLIFLFGSIELPDFVECGA